MGSVSLLIGPSGIGKTSLGLAFLGASTVQAPGLHFGFYETPERLRNKAASLGYDFAAMEQDGSLQLCWQPTTEGLLDQIGARLLERVEAQGSKRVLIDSLGHSVAWPSIRRGSMGFSAPSPASCVRVM